MPYRLLLEHLTSQPWFVTREMFNLGLDILNREHTQDWTPRAVSQKTGRDLDGTKTATIRDGVAIIPVVGTIFRYANLITDHSGGATIEQLALDFRAALDNPAVKAIMLEINSPGGQVSGTGELANAIYDARAKKPVVAYGSFEVASGGYYLASAASELVIAPSALLGSVGVVMGARKPDDPAKSRHLEIVSSQSPYKRPDLSTQKGQDLMQERVDALAQVFLDDVAKFRGVAGAQVLADFGQGGIKVGQAAVDAGMADRLGSLEATLAELVRRTSTRTHTSFPTASQAADSGATKMDNPLKWFFSKSPEEQAMVRSLVGDGNSSTQVTSDIDAVTTVLKPQAAQFYQGRIEETQLSNSSEVADLQRQLAELQKARETDAAAAQAALAQSRRIAVEASLDAFIAEQVREQRVYPHEKETLKASLVELSLSDATVAHAQRLKDSIVARPKHGLLGEQLPGGLPPGASHTLPSSHPDPKTDPNAPVSKERIAQLLAMTNLGQTALAKGQLDRYNGHAVPAYPSAPGG